MARAVVDKIEDVPEALRTEYEPGPGGKFLLKIEGLDPEVDHPAVKPLRAAKLHEKTAREKAEAEVKRIAEEAEARIAEMRKRQEEASPQAQIDGLRKSYEEREAANIAKAIGPKDEEIKRLAEAINKATIRRDAQAVALAVAAAPEYASLIEREIMPRLVTEFGSDGEPRTRVLDSSGQPSAITLDALKEEIMSDPRFKPLLKGSPATGGGAVSASGGGGASTGTIDLSKATMAEKVAYYEKRNRIQH